MTNTSWPRANTSYTMPTEGPKPCVECQRLQARLDGVMAENERLKKNLPGNLLAVLNDHMSYLRRSSLVFSNYGFHRTSRECQLAIIELENAIKSAGGNNA